MEENSLSPGASPAEESQNRGGTGSPGQLKSLISRGESIYHELSAILREVLQRKKIPIHLTRRVQLALEAELDPRGSDELPAKGDASPATKFAKSLVSRIHILAQKAAPTGDSFPLGKVRCFWCKTFDCPHSEPPDPRSVFKAYSPTGQPIWLELAALALEEHHPEVEKFYLEHPAPIVLIQSGSHVTREQLGVYGKRSNLYRILGQVLVGYLPFQNGKNRFALTIQAVETKRPEIRHHLNLIGVLPDRRPTAPFIEEVANARLADAIATARGKLQEIALLQRSSRDGEKKPKKGRPRRPDFKEREKRALQILQKLGRTLDRIYRQSSRRTLHGRDRHRDRERPASTAFRDALQANSVYHDVKEGTWVVVGPRRRVHVFNDQGHHITSVVYSGETIRKRTTKGKWKNGSPEELQSFQQKLQRLAKP